MLEFALWRTRGEAFLPCICPPTMQLKPWEERCLVEHAGQIRYDGLEANSQQAVQA